MAPTALDASISAIDALIEKLQSGALLGAAAPPPAASPPPPAAEPAPPAAAKKAAKKEKPVKPAKSGGGGGGGAAALEGAELFGRAHFAVARVASVVPHPASDKLYITQLDVGGGATRQVVAGLRKHVAQGALEGSTVAVVLNLKPARLAGEASEGMILAASVPQVRGPLRACAACWPALRSSQAQLGLRRPALRWRMHPLTRGFAPRRRATTAQSWSRCWCSQRAPSLGTLCFWRRRGPRPRTAPRTPSS